jgi:hypothetical protein
MGGGAFPISLALGSMLLSIWVDLRLERFRPSSPASRIGHAAAAYLVLQLSVAATSAFFEHAPAFEQLAAVFLLVLPCLVYAFLTGVWLMRTLADVAVSRR